MKCNITDCYWNLYDENSEHYNDEIFKECVHESLDEHYDPNNDFELTPDSKECEGYRYSYRSNGGKNND